MTTDTETEVKTNVASRRGGQGVDKAPGESLRLHLRRALAEAVSEGLQANDVILEVAASEWNPPEPIENLATLMTLYSAQRWLGQREFRSCAISSRCSSL